MPARAASGSQATARPRSRNAAKVKTPESSPEARVRPPLDKLTKVGAMAPEPGTPPARPEARLPRPWPTSSRSEAWRERVRASKTTQVLSVSKESSTESVKAGKNTSRRSARPSVAASAQRMVQAPNPALWPPTGPITRGLSRTVRSSGSRKARQR